MVWDFLLPINMFYKHIFSYLCSIKHQIIIAMIDTNLILHLPFDDPDGNVAYDYSKSRKDGTLSNGAGFTKKAKVGIKALDLGDEGECLTAQTIPFSSDFTLTFWVKATTNKVGWLLNFSGINNFIEKWVDVTPDEWIFFSFVKKTSSFVVYENGNEVQNVALTATPVGFSFNDNSLFGSNICFDEVKLFNVAKTQAEIMKLQSDSLDVEYYINGINFKDFGVSVSDSSGHIGMLVRKEGLSVEYENYHGRVEDKKRPRYKERTIQLDCFIEGFGKSAFLDLVYSFMKQFDQPGNQRLKIEYDGATKPLVYEIFIPGGFDVKKTWSYNNDLMVGTFSLKLREDEPVKRVLRHIGLNANTQATITVSTYKLLNIYWGDGTHTYDVSGTNRQVTHTYSNPGEYDIIITGVIEDIEAFTTNCIIVWDRLL
jgi:hypothetical protein